MIKDANTTPEQLPRPRIGLPTQVKAPESGLIDNDVDALAGLDPATDHGAAGLTDPKEPNLIEQFSEQLGQKQPVERVARVVPNPGR